MLKPVLAPFLLRLPAVEAASVQLHQVETGSWKEGAAALSCGLPKTMERKTGSDAYVNEMKPVLMAALSVFPAAASVRSLDVRK